MSSIYLPSTTDKIQLVTASAVSVDCHVFFNEYKPTDTSLRPTSDRQISKVTTATTTDILSSPASLFTRGVDFVNIRNTHATSSNLIEVLYNANGTTSSLYKVTLAPGEILAYNDKLGSWYVYSANIPYPWVGYIVGSDQTGQNIATVQPWFPTTGGVTVPIGTYWMEGHLYLSTGATTHTTAMSLTGTATLTSIDYLVKLWSGAAAITILTTAPSVTRVNVATSTVLNATSTNVETIIDCEGVVRVSAAGTFIPNYTFSANPTGTILTKRGSYFQMQQLPGDNTTQTWGVWA